MAGSTTENVIKVVGEVACPIPGTSQLISGNVKSGLGHALAGVIGASLLGPLGVLLVKANSLSTSLGDQNLYNQIRNTTSSE